METQNQDKLATGPEKRIEDRPIATPNPERKLKRRRRWPWVLAGVLLIAIAIIFFRRGKSTAEPAGAKSRAAQPPVMVTTATAQKGDIGIHVSALGVVTPVNTVSVRSRVDGQLMKVNYQEGQLVRAGDPLAEIDPAPFQAALGQAEGQLARDQPLLENAKIDLDRYQVAFRSNAIPKQQLDTQVSTVHQYEGVVKLDQAQVQNARVQLAYCTIVSPISGRAGLRLVDAGNIVHASDTTPLVVITELQPITVIFSVAEDYLPQIQAQLRQGKRLAVDAFDRAQQKQIASGVLQTLDNQIDTTTGTLKLKALFPNEDTSLFPNQFVNARLLVDTHHNVTLVPNQVIQRNAQGAFVYELKPDETVVMHQITIGAADGNTTEVQGLDPGAVVAGDNFNRLTEGAKVTVRQAGGGAGPGAGAPTGAGPPNGGRPKKKGPG